MPSLIVHSDPFDLEIEAIMWHMVNMLESVPSQNPYEKPISPDHDRNAKPRTNEPTLVICASEIIKALEILSPQTLHPSLYSSDPVLRSIADARKAELEMWPKTKFDLLKQRLSQLTEPSVTATEIHPCLELWAEFTVDTIGRPEPFQVYEELPHQLDRRRDRDFNIAQKAALRLCSDASLQPAHGEQFSNSYWTQTSTLRDLFEQQIFKSQAETRMVDKIYWKRALETLDKLQSRFRPLETSADDTEVLSVPFKLFSTFREESMIECHSLVDLIGSYENAYRVLKQQVGTLMSGLEELRLKLWYTSQVIHSAVYHDARNVASALGHMTLPTLQNTTRTMGDHRESMRPSTSGSSRSSIFGEPQSDTMKLLKAPTEYGGPRKLADEQIANIKYWLKQNNIDNFCVAEERLHRFCMEVHLVTKKLTGENMLQSPDLWSSELFMRERVSYDVHTVGISSAPASTSASTRPSSIYGESTSYPMSRTVLRSLDSDVRSVSSDERSSMRRGSLYSIFPRGGLNPQLLTPELANSISSYGGRTPSATTSTSDIFSQPIQSVTSASVYSRTSSILNGSLLEFASRPPPALKEKKKFREQLRKGLCCLLLSDLGSMIWSWGCETDKWVEVAQETKSVQLQFRHRMATDALLHPEKGLPETIGRRNSADGIVTEMTPLTMTKGTQAFAEVAEDAYITALQDILSRMGKQVDPAAKLQACVDFYDVALEQMQANSDSAQTGVPNVETGRPILKTAKSYDDRLIASGQGTKITPVEALTEPQIVNHLKRQLAELKPTRIFRDLQFTAVFASSEMSDKKAAGEAFLRLGMAALEYKGELCSSMVDVADKIMANEATKESKPHTISSLKTAAYYWQIAALERNRVAQRELAMLYLVRPDILPIITAPLATTSDIFRDDMMWQRKTKSNERSDALCLALHWMQQAAINGDDFAKVRIAERREFREQEQGLSIR